jgi:hydroxymethylpyrimidine pyrophosphatase-like HAD family hydrolase
LTIRRAASRPIVRALRAFQIARRSRVVQAALGQHATANRSQPYYLDVTHKDANKGTVVDYLSAHLDNPPAEIATIDDSPNDVLMFKHSGFSIAMGNASGGVKSEANVTTDSYNDEGFAKAIERFVLGGLA